MMANYDISWRMMANDGDVMTDNGYIFRLCLQLSQRRRQQKDAVLETVFQIDVGDGNVS